MISYLNQFLLVFLLLFGDGTVTWAIDRSTAESQPVRDQSNDKIDFKRDVQPILAASCYDCHAGENTDGGVRWDQKSALLGGDSGEVAVVPGKPDEGSLLARVRGEEDLMPPEDEGEPLTETQIAILQRWIKQGADWPDEVQASTSAPTHWSLIQPLRHEPPETKNKEWARNSIDPFVLARLEQEGLSPSPEADRYTLVRRLYLYIFGVSPTIEEADQFVNDTRPDAYEQLVDRLLASPQYGERWARMWLDLARYADTQGYEKDNRRTIYRYRDWVIGAFNRDLPFDQFTIEQIAGDMLPSATMDQNIATAFHRNTMTNTEGGTDDEEFRTAAIIDRVNTTGQVWLGLTVGCSQCHSHKYDPLTQREYYQLYAFLNQTVDNDQPNEAPIMATPSSDLVGKIDALMVQTTKQRKTIENYHSPEFTAAESQWAKRLAEEGLPDSPKFATWNVLGPFPAKSYQEALAGKFVSEPEIDLDKTYLDGKLHWEEKSEYLDNKVHVLQAEKSAYYFYRTIDVEGLIPFDFSFGSNDSIKVWLNGRVILDNQVERSAQPDQDRVPVQLRAGENRLLVKIVNGAENGGFFFRPIDSPLTENALRIAQSSPEQRTSQESETLTSYYRTVAPSLQPLRQELLGIEFKLQTLREESDSPTTPIMRELDNDNRRDTHVLLRGSFLSKGPKVEPGVPTALHPLPTGAPSNRLGLAQWLVDQNNPLTARVAVNRFWEKMFGLGLVETSEDFGTQGSPPTHPKLLDRMAIEFMQQGWSMKKLIRRIALSATYRQSSRTTPELVEKDQGNQLLARGPRFRLEAEMVRDQALAISGLLSKKMFGESVMPPQPAGVWQVVYSSDQWKTSQGEDRYRRGLYTFWRRTSPYPSMIAFDATSREICTVRRIRTNTPLAALVTLNDPVYVEAAQATARLVVRQGGSTIKDRAIYAFRRCLVRPPKPAELERIVALYQHELKQYRENTEAAKLMATQGLGAAPADSDIHELAAWTVVANVLLNLDETLTKG
jgi:hypothetical protein